LTTFGGKVSNEYPILFVPDPDYKILPASDVTLIQCGTQTDYDTCNGWLDPDDVDSFFVGPPPDAEYTFAGSHGFGFSFFLESDTDETDVFRMTVKNDWILQSISFSKHVEDSADTVSYGPDFHQVTTWQPTVGYWVFGPNDTIWYVGVVGISGPKGVPYK